MNIKTVVAAVALLSASLAAHADVTYTFTGGAGQSAGTSFTVVSSGFLSYSPAGVPATGEDYLFGTDEGAITGVNFLTDETIGVETAGGGANGVYFANSSGNYDISMDGIYTDHFGSRLTVTGSPSVTPTPEPSSILLLGTGVLGIAGVMRRRFA